MVTLKVEKSKLLPEGQHLGVIVGTDRRENPYNYLDIDISVSPEQKISVSYPAVVSVNSSLGRLLTRFGALLKEGEDIDLDRLLVGRKVVFSSIIVAGTNDGVFARVERHTLRPVGEGESPAVNPQKLYRWNEDGVLWEVKEWDRKT